MNIYDATEIAFRNGYAKGVEDQKKGNTRNMFAEFESHVGEKIKIKLHNGAFEPTRGHEFDAGLDIRAADSQVVPAHGSAVFDTGVCVQIPEGYVGFLKSKSGLNVNHGLRSEGVIDCGYTGSIRVKLYNDSPNDYAVYPGDKISQLVILPIITPDIEIVEELEETERGSKGFGSTGR